MKLGVNEGVGVYVGKRARTITPTRYTYILINKRPPNMSMQHQPVSYKVIKFHKSPSIKRLFDIELLNKKLLIVV